MTEGKARPIERIRAEEDLERVGAALRILWDSTAWETVVAWYPAMSPRERDAFDFLRALAVR